ncbi:MAG: DUF6125 family protein [Acidobacteriota bacterium]
MHDYGSYSREMLARWLEDAAKLWLAHDGLWFQAVESMGGLEAAVKCDAEAWSRFSPLEAKRIMERLEMAPGGGLPTLAQALRARLYSLLNEDEIALEQGRLVYTMKRCRVQEARRRKGLADFPCKSVGIVEYTTFAHTIDPRIRTQCLACPPEPHDGDFYCSWEFTM